MIKSLSKQWPYVLFLGSMVLAGACKKAADQPGQPVQHTSSLLSGPQQGKPFSSGMINDFTLAGKNGDVALLAVNNTTGLVYAIDIKDNDASQAAANTITTPVTTFMTSVATKLGIDPGSMSIRNMEINPVSKSIYLLVGNTSNNTTILVKATNGGSEISVVNLDDVPYSAVKFSDNGQQVNDITWGDGKLYISFNVPGSLTGSVATAAAPFQHGASVSTRATTVFKTNWGGSYFTDAPLENMTYAEIAGEKRLLGVTVCAPGFSFKTSDITAGTGLLQVKEYFNLNTGYAVKVFTVTQNNKTYLVELHETGKLRRVGEKYLDESQAGFNNQSKYLLTGGGTIVGSGLTDEDVKLLSPSDMYVMAAAYGDASMLVISNTGTLSVMTM